MPGGPAPRNLPGGIISVCAQRRSTRDDKLAWQQMEVYVRDRTEAESSHGLCPKCVKDLYGKGA